MRISHNSWLITSPIAHRGLWGGDIQENTLSAYKNAAEKGLPIEIDVYLSTDGEIFSFHDEKLMRMTGEEGLIYKKSSKEIKQLRIKGTDEYIPTFEEVLQVCKGKSPILIEIKNQPNNRIVDKLVKRLKEYNGEFAIQSFNPFYMLKVKKLAPEFIRGVLTDPDQQNHTAFKRFIIKKMPINFLVKPDFLACKYTGLDKIKKRAKNKAILAWTVTSTQTQNAIKGKCDNIIFENFIPQ